MLCLYDLMVCCVLYLCVAISTFSRFCVCCRFGSLVSICLVVYAYVVVLRVPWFAGFSWWFVVWFWLAIWI